MASRPPPPPSSAAPRVSVTSAPGSDRSDRSDGATVDESSFVLILPVLLLEYLAIGLAKALLPRLLIQAYGDSTYLVAGAVEALRGFEAFLASPLFGKLSDRYGRRPSLLISVVGTTAPMIPLAIGAWMGDGGGVGHKWVRAWVWLQALAGLAGATFLLAFAYTADLVPPSRRAEAYGLALATFGLSFCVGPIVGSFVARRWGESAVFLASAAMIVLDVLYILLVLPESKQQSSQQLQDRGPPGSRRFLSAAASARTRSAEEVAEILRLTSATAASIVSEMRQPAAWNLSRVFGIMQRDAFLRTIAEVVALYYLAVWAVVSTLMLYVTRQMGFSLVETGWLMSAFGLCTMFAEGVLVRVLVPRIGEVRAVQAGLASFALQCLLLGLAGTFAASAGDGDSDEQEYRRQVGRRVVFCSMLLSLLSNLVYPSISSLISRAVRPDEVGEALGAMNGLKSLMEGVAPLVFGLLLSVAETTPAPGAPYLLAAASAACAVRVSARLPTSGVSSDAASQRSAADREGEAEEELAVWREKQLQRDEAARGLLAADVEADEGESENEAHARRGL